MTRVLYNFLSVLANNISDALGQTHGPESSSDTCHWEGYHSFQNLHGAVRVVVCVVVCVRSCCDTADFVCTWLYVCYIMINVYGGGGCIAADLHRT